MALDDIAEDGEQARAAKSDSNTSAIYRSYFIAPLWRHNENYTGPLSVKTIRCIRTEPSRLHFLAQDSPCDLLVVDDSANRTIQRTV